MHKPETVRVKIADLMRELGKDHLDPIASMFPEQATIALIILAPGNTDIVMSNSDDLDPIVEAIRRTQGPDGQIVDLTPKVIH